MSGFQFQADMYNSITPEEVKVNELESKVNELQAKIEKLENPNVELEKKFYEELQKEFIENHTKGDDVCSSMIKGMATVLANIYRDLWRP